MRIDHSGNICIKNHSAQNFKLEMINFNLLNMGIFYFTIFSEIVSALEKTKKPPCCMDTLSSSACQRLRREKKVHFARRCNHDIEFRLIQCCSTCNRFKRAIPYDRIAPSLVRMNCEDRYGESFCKKYVSDLDVWTYKQWSCSGYSPYMAFRACRKTCGFCDFSQVHYNIKNATDACKTIQNR